ncbi:retinitis pigmentosa 9 (autosomal dominant) L homeolog isoform X1 [Xenopus laevis]|uniref:MGC154533 protein n=2 Tax=Xenopus laevis TaxID=8355 RepID=Q0IH84_XENLA|nr:retinitis pigmentosa 9 (autosomal dominant) L homeolog [Xenopus laevis]XP_018122237.1 retinitis pigmentosa 9 (autosomal dominant) L homeolog isoform X1 [Xenopus laevis]XP_018122238.1 retinitis pigmentosa 9 (autosomal dominant) L homeolog isoform X1 [Xenopus laevis]XP_018122239.1 retinitis pigmentosa 9 (autosomal dominant) L homeolog isoform X1 [Xenopus laevis]XP_018122243.1 retinitis pigmentosa 9 (autosomal dominant) L homeolog isoform X1 [Xenopus laevis]XP_041421532.1 retinitis pigmentosa 
MSCRRKEEPRNKHSVKHHRRDEYDAGSPGSTHDPEQEHSSRKRRRSSSSGTHTSQEIQKIKHVETFYEKPPPGLIKEDEPKPEDCIPDLPGNEHARDFLAHAPTKGLWMPLGKQVKVMQCWRCKQYGHRTGDRECPYFIKGNQKIEQFRVAHEDPMYGLIKNKEHEEKQMRIQQLKKLLEDSTSDESSSSSSDDSHSKHKKKKKKKEKRKKKKKKHKYSQNKSSSE